MQTSGSLSSPLVDERLNQLDEFQSQSDVAQSRGSAPQSQSVLAGLTQVVHEVSDDPADSVPSSAESAPVHDVRMAEPSGAQKQVSPRLLPLMMLRNLREVDLNFVVGKLCIAQVRMCLLVFHLLPFWLV